MCKVKIKSGDMLPIKEGIQKIRAINFVCISRARKRQTLNVERSDKTATVLKITARRLLRHLEIKAVIVPAKADITAIKDKIRAAFETSKLQKSCKNFLPITVCNT